MKNTLYIVWNEYNNLGIAIIDEQHRGIVATINSLHYFIQEGQGEDVMNPTLSMLEHYTKVHFLTEEALMKKTGYPAFDEHVTLHGELMKRTRAIAREASLGKDPETVFKFLKEWWLGHINGEHRKYAPHVKTALEL